MVAGDPVGAFAAIVPTFVHSPGNGRRTTQPQRAKGASAQSLSKQANETAAFLLFQFRFRIPSDASLFHDSQSLLYLCASHALLPELDRNQLTEARDRVVTAMWLHCLTWESDVAHMLYLRSQLYDYLERATDATRDLMESFRLTDPDEHVYVTKAQAVWTSMLEENKVSDAIDFLLGVYRVCPREARDEVREMLDETYAIASPKKRQSGKG